jgi:hypothetical protein
MIRPEDRRPPEKFEVELPAPLADRLRAFAFNLKDEQGYSSSPEYVIRALLDEHVPPFRTGFPERKNTRAKAAAK